MVVFSAPQLSLFELRDLADLCEGRQFSVPLLAVTSPQVKPDSDRWGTPHALNMPVAPYCRACASINPMHGRLRKPMVGSGSRPIASKLVNILGGYGYKPILASMEECVDAAVSGSLA